MPIQIDQALTPQSLVPALEGLFERSAEKILLLEKNWKSARGTPVFTIRGRYAARGWTEWTQGFRVGSALLQYDATGERRFLDQGRRETVELMATHVSHMGVHDHGFNTISTYGNLLRLMREGRIPDDGPERDFCELAIKVSGAVQAARWTSLPEGRGYIYSFNGPQSLFIDTLRTLRVLGVAHQLGHVLLGEGDRRISLLRRLLDHAETTALSSVYYGEDRDAYDVSGRVAHEIIFNPVDGSRRCPSSQQGYSPFTTWTRGLAWAVCGFAEQLEFLHHLSRHVPENQPPSLAEGCHPVPLPELAAIRQRLLKAARATADYYLRVACADGVPMWDTGAPNLHRLPSDYLERPADPFNRWEPVDSSAAAIAAQGLARLGHYLAGQGDKARATRYVQAALTIARTLLGAPYLAPSGRHQGLLLHSVYHRPNGWDYIAPGQKVPNGESSMWGDYHLRELGLILWRAARREHYLTFFLPPTA
jgi:unsaturated chondroitin disaccharide hydrolase